MPTNLWNNYRGIAPHAALAIYVVEKQLHPFTPTERRNPEKSYLSRLDFFEEGKLFDLVCGACDIEKPEALIKIKKKLSKLYDQAKHKNVIDIWKIY